MSQRQKNVIITYSFYKFVLSHPKFCHVNSKHPGLGRTDISHQEPAECCQSLFPKLVSLPWQHCYPGFCLRVADSMFSISCLLVCHPQLEYNIKRTSCIPKVPSCFHSCCSGSGLRYLMRHLTYFRHVCGIRNTTVKLLFPLAMIMSSSGVTAASQMGSDSAFRGLEWRLVRAQH